MRLSELDHGEMDIKIASNQDFHALNYTLIQKEILNVEPYLYHTPRVTHALGVYFGRYCEDRVPEESYWKYYPMDSEDYCGYYAACFQMHCPSPYFPANAFFLDIDREREILLGRDWTLPAIKKGEVYISDLLAKSAGVSKGQYVYVPVDLVHFFGEDILNVSKYAYLEAYVPFKIAEIYSDAHGKYSSEYGSVIMIDYDSFVPHLVDNMDPETWSPELINTLSKINFRDYASYVVVNFPPPRVSPYLQSNYDILQKNVIDFSNPLFYKVGFLQVNKELPVLSGLSITRTKIISLFLGLILNIIIFILLFLSILLIYSLLMINVETRTFELGVMRMIGINSEKRNIRS